MITELVVTVSMWFAGVSEGEAITSVSMHNTHSACLSAAAVAVEEILLAIEESDDGVLLKLKASCELLIEGQGNKE